MALGLGNLFGGAHGGPSNPFPNPYEFLKKSLKDPASLQFQDWIKNINAPSSVDQVRSEADNERLKQLMQGIDEDTARSVGNVKLDAEERGLGGPGIASDIEFGGIGAAESGGVKAKSSARLDAFMKELDRLTGRETAARDAYGSRYSSGVSSANNLASLLASLYTGGAQREQAGTEGGYLDSFLRNIRTTIGLSS